MRIDVLTLFPEMFAGVLGSSIVKRAADAVRDPATGDVRPPVASYHLHNLRDWTTDKHHKVDQPPFGGGPGMVIQCQPVWDAVRAIEAMDAAPPIRVLLTPQGQPLTQPIVERLAQAPRLLLIAGHYEGIDERVIDRLRTTAPGVPASAGTPQSPPHLLELSIGDYVLSGGELPAMVLIDAVVRLLPGALGHDESAHHDSFSPGAQRLLDHPHYTRPRVWEGMEAPEVLLSGNHAAIDTWRREQALQRTRERRPDLVAPLEPHRVADAPSTDGDVLGAGSLTLRDELPTDANGIDRVHRLAFPGDAEARLVRALREAGDLAISCVAEQGGQLIGHVAVSPMALVEQPSITGYLGLGPVAVVPDHQRQGVGSVLVEMALDRCRQAAARAVFVLGEPAFYSRFGFEPARRHGFTSDYPDAGDAFQILVLRPPLPDAYRGPIRYAPAFAAL